MKRCERCGHEAEDWLFMEVEKGKFICIPCANEITRKHWGAS